MLQSLNFVRKNFFGKTAVSVLALALVAMSAYAAPAPKLILRAEIKTDAHGHITRMQSVQPPTSPEEEQAQIKWAEGVLKNAAAKNPNVKQQIVVLAPSGDQEPAQELVNVAEQIAQGVQPSASVAHPPAVNVRLFEVNLPKQETFSSKTKAWFSKYGYRLGFTVVRAVANTGGLTLSLYLAGAPVSHAIWAGASGGLMSAGFMWYNDQFTNWLTPEKNWLVDRLLPKESYKVDLNKINPTPFRLPTVDAKKIMLESVGWWRMFEVQVGYLGVVKGVALLSGIPVHQTLIENVHSLFSNASMWSIAMSAGLGTIAQAPWNIGIAKEKRLDLEKHPEMEKKIKFKADLKMAAASVAQVASMVAYLMKVPLSGATLAVMGVTGIGYYLKTIYDFKKWDLEKVRALGCEDALLP